MKSSEPQTKTEDFACFLKQKYISLHIFESLMQFNWLLKEKSKIPLENNVKLNLFYG